MTREAVFTSGILIGAGVVSVIWMLSTVSRRLYARYQDHRSERWTDKDATEIEAFENYVQGYKTDTEEFERVRVEPEWVRPLEEHGKLIPPWRPAVPPPPALFKGPPVWKVGLWLRWNFSDWLTNWSIDGNQQERIDRVVRTPPEEVVPGPEAGPSSGAPIPA